jgi:MerR family transcriptional regulator, redox-sensitive transcriptional activator SoxR
MDELTIGEVARRTGVRTSALRYYEDAGILPPPRRVNGRRRYPPLVLRMVEVLRFAQQAGFTLDEIRTLFHGFGAEIPLRERWEALAVAKLRELDELIARAGQMKRAIEVGLGCGCVRLEDCVIGVPCQPASPDRPGSVATTPAVE